MGFYNLATQAPVYRSATSGAVPSAPWMQQPSVSQYELFQQYYSPFSEDEYDKKAFSRATTEAINHGLNIPKDVKKSMEELAKNGDKWFDNEGNLLEGLSEKEARKATEHRKRVYYYYDKLKRKYVSPERKRAQWASKNFIKNGFDTTAANQYAALTNYSDLANLWGGDVSGALKGGLYGAKASANEKAFYDKLTAPQKRAYLNQREQWVKSGLLKAAGGQDLSNGLQAVTDQDMLKYIQDNIQNWQNSFYGNNGYDDEYELSHPVYDQNTAYLYQLYGIPQAQTSQAWVPTNTIRTSGFFISTPQEKATNHSSSRGSRKQGKQRKQGKSIKQNGTETISYEELPSSDQFNGKKKIYATNVVNAATEYIRKESADNNMKFTDAFNRGVVYDQSGNPYVQDTEGDVYKVVKSGNNYAFTNIKDSSKSFLTPAKKKGGKLLKCDLGNILKKKKSQVHKPTASVKPTIPVVADNDLSTLKSIFEDLPRNSWFENFDADEDWLGNNYEYTKKNPFTGKKGIYQRFAIDPNGSDGNIENLWIYLPNSGNSGAFIEYQGKSYDLGKNIIGQNTWSDNDIYDTIYTALYGE